MDYMVYFIRNGKRGCIKIGHTTNMQRRIDTLQVGNPTKLFLLGKILCGSKAEAMSLELHLHSIFKSQRIRGEWFAHNIKLARVQDLEVNEPKLACMIESISQY